MNYDELWVLYKDRGLKSVDAQNVSAETMNKFLCQLIYRDVFKSGGRCDELWAEIQEYPKIYKDNHNFSRIVKKARKDAAYLMLGRDPLVFERWGIENNTIPKRLLHRNDLMPSISERGVHIVHGRIGSGKSEGIILPDLAQYGRSARILIVSPNMEDVRNITKSLGDDWNHYHAFGTDAASVKKALQTFDKIVVCAGSLRHYKEFNSYKQTFNCIYVDEITQLLKTYSNREKATPAYRESLETLFDLVSCSGRSLFLSADITERNTLETLGRTASLSEQKIRYYRNNVDYAEGSNWTMFREEWDLFFEIVDRINSGQRFWGTVDFADTKNPYFKEFVKLLKEYCPTKKIQAFTADTLKNTFKGKLLKEQGLKDYIIEQTDLEELDGIITTTWARHNVSLMFEEEKYRMDFSFGIHRGINDPEDVIQGHRRDRLITDHLVYVKNNGTFPIWENSVLYKGELLSEVPHIAGKEEFENSTIGRKMLKAATDQYYREAAQKSASRSWLTKLHLRDMGAKVHDYELNLEKRSEYFLKLRNEYREKVLNPKKIENWESIPFQRMRLFDEFIQYSEEENGWVQVLDDSSVKAEELSAIRNEVDINLAERLRLILTMDTENRMLWDSHDMDSYYKETGILLDLIFSRLSPNGCFGSLAKWYLTAPAGAVWFGLIAEEESIEASQLIRDNYREIYRQTLGNGSGTIRTMEDFIVKVIGKHLELEIWTKVSKPRVNEWRQKLFDQYYKEKGGKFLKRMTLKEKYAVIEECLREKIRRGLSESFSDPELRMLDTMTDVIKVKRPDRPILSRIWDIYSKSTYLDGSVVHLDREDIELQISGPKRKILELISS